MILDHIANIDTYKNLGERIDQAIEFIKTTDFSNYSTGRNEISEDTLFFIVNEYETKNISCEILESHRKYIDLQYMLSGNEKINYELFIDQKVKQEYDKENDYSLFYPEQNNQFVLSHGMFALFFPNDLHMPGFANNKSEAIRKIVVKIQID